MQEIERSKTCMTDDQRKFWKAVKALARATRRGANVDLECAADALTLEQEIDQRMFGEEQPMLAVAEPQQSTEETRNGRA